MQYLFQNFDHAHNGFALNTENYCNVVPLQTLIIFGSVILGKSNTSN